LRPSSGQTLPLTKQLLYIDGKLDSLAFHRRIKLYTLSVKSASYLGLNKTVHEKKKSTYKEKKLFDNIKKTV